MKIIIDVMSGDNAPEEIIKGVLMAYNEYPDVDMVMTGNKYIIKDMFFQCFFERKIYKNLKKAVLEKPIRPVKNDQKFKL